jgi:hypothetical protein
VYSQIPGDIFIHTWNTVNTNRGSYWNGWDDLTGKNLEESSKLADISGIHASYNPKILYIEQDKDPNVPIEYIKDHHFSRANLGVKNMLEGSRKIFEIARNYKKYDIYFSTRMDINYTEKFKVEELSKDHILCSNSRPDGIYDIWMAGPENYMDVKTKYYYFIDDYWYKKNYNEIFYESALKEYLIGDNKIPVSISNSKCEIVRIFGNSTFVK